MPALLFFHALTTVTNSKFEQSVMKHLCEAGLQGCCFGGQVTLACEPPRQDADGFLCNEPGLPCLGSGCFPLGSFWSAVIEQNSNRLQLSD